MPCLRAREKCIHQIQLWLEEAANFWFKNACLDQERFPLIRRRAQELLEFIAKHLLQHGSQLRGFGAALAWRLPIPLQQRI